MKNSESVLLVSVSLYEEMQATILEHLLPLSDHPSFNQYLLQGFGYTSFSSAPIATVTAGADGLPPGDWIRADPVMLRVDWAKVYMLGNDFLTLNNNETQQLLNLINEYFLNENLQLLAPHPRRWYLKLNSEINFTGYDPNAVIGKSIMTLLPSVSIDPRWIKFFNEIQMLLFNCKVNQERAKKNEPTVDALWFWGAGIMQDIKEKMAWDEVITNDILAVGLAQQHKILLQEYNNSIKETLNRLEKSRRQLICLRLQEDPAHPGKVLDELLAEVSQAHRNFNKVLLYINNQCYQLNSKFVCN